MGLVTEEVKVRLPVGMLVEIVAGSVNTAWIGLCGTVHGYTPNHIRVQFERSLLNRSDLSGAECKQSFRPKSIKALSAGYADPVRGTREWTNFEHYAQQLYDAERLPMDERDIVAIEALRRDAAKARKYLDTKRRSLTNP